MIELKLRQILRQVKSDKPKIRYEALGKLYQYKNQDGLEIQVDVLKDMIKTAASKFPERVDRWDNPSFYLIEFVCDFPMREVVESLIQHFDGLDLQAKEQAIELLIMTESKEVFYFIEEKIINLMQTEDFIIPVRALSSYPVLMKGILDSSLEKLSSSHYKFMLYRLLLAFNSSGYELGYNKEVVLPFLLEDYHNEKQEYLKFDSEYSTKHAYSAWKDSYFILRNRMTLFIHLMEYYYTPAIGFELEEALNFQDPLIRTETLLVCISKNLPFKQSTLLECAEHIESAENIYWELKLRNLEHLYPITERKQPHLAKTRLFFTIINLPDQGNEQPFFPEDIQVIDKVEAENPLGELERYYLMRFKEQGDMYVGWAGGYAFEEDDDAANIKDVTYTDFVEFDSATIQEHKQAFFKKRRHYKSAHENTVYFESSPKLSKGAWFILAILISSWFRVVSSGFKDPLLPAIVITILGGAYCLYESVKNKKRKISIIGPTLVKQDGAKQYSSNFHDIKKIECNKRHILTYNMENELVFKFPLRWVRYELFHLAIKEHSAHLKSKIIIQSKN